MPLTSSQTAAIEHSGGHLQLIACAGSGKTEVVARHIVRLLTPTSSGGGGLLPRNIIAFTFTEKAASELKERIVQRCRETLSLVTGMAEMYVGTIHGFCLELLRSEVPRFLKYDVLNDIQQTLLVDRNSAKSGLTTTTTLQGERLRRYVDTRLYIEAVSILRESDVDWSALAGVSVAHGLTAYTALLDEKGYFDYSSILQEAVTAVTSDPTVRQNVASRARVVVVDEYQDVNPIQERLIGALRELGADIRIVGDDDQTIFQWRGSDCGNILTFCDRYAQASSIKLEDNFRSTTGITDVARLVIGKNTGRLEKEMRSANQQDYEVGDIVALQFPSPKEEAAYIAAKCKALVGTKIKDGDEERNISWSDMAVLVRFTKLADPIREALRREGVPVVSVGMTTLFDAPEAEAARQLFYFMVGRADKATALKSWRDANLGVDDQLLVAAIDATAQTREKMRVEDQEVRFSVYNIQRQFMGFLGQIGLREELVPGGRGEIAFYNLAKFSQAISDFEAIYFHSRPVLKYESFAGFLEHQAEDVYGQSAGADDKFIAPDAVQILTVHRAKGLQWPLVFVPQLVRNHFPAAARGGRNVWHLIPSSAVGGSARFRGSEEDERRLFYVAVTRSQKHLHLTTAPTPGSTRYVHPSSFWYDVLESKYVKRTAQNLADRLRGPAQPKASITNVHLSFSDMRYFFECPYQFKMRTLFGFNPPLAEALGYGKSLHDALAELHTRAIAGERISEDDADTLVDRHLRVPYAYPTLRETMRNSAKKVIRAYIAARSGDFDKLELSEKSIEVTLPNGVSVSGRIDLVRRRDTDEIAIVDLKSNERAQAEELTEAQLHIYALGYRELTGTNADFVETYELDTQTRKPRAVDEDLIKEVVGRVDETANALRRNEFAAAPKTVQCRRCDFCNLCTAGSQVVGSVS